MLTKAEALVAAARAETYPRWRGFWFFGANNAEHAAEVERVLKQRPDLEADG